MRYEYLSSSEKKSFQRSLSKTIDEYLQDNDYYIEEVTMEFVNMIVVILKNKSSYGFQKWASQEFEIPDDEMFSMVDKKITNLRKKKPTDKQLEYFRGMCRDLGVDDTVPEDNLLFRRQLEELRERYQVEGPATEAQVNGVKKSLQKAFGYELDIPVLTRGEVQDYFELVGVYNGSELEVLDKTPRTGDTSKSMSVSIDEDRFTLYEEGKVTHRGSGYCMLCCEEVDEDNQYSVCDGGEELFPALWNLFEWISVAR